VQAEKKKEKRKNETKQSIKPTQPMTTSKCKIRTKKHTNTFPLSFPRIVDPTRGTAWATAIGRVARSDSIHLNLVIRFVGE
jgi:hypothetical protein